MVIVLEVFVLIKKKLFSNNKKGQLIRIRNKALTQQFKNIIDDYISFNVDISEGYWEDIDTSREGT